MVEGYVLHAYGSERYLKQTIASVRTIRRHDERRPVSLYASENLVASLRESGLDRVFDLVKVLPEEHCSIVGFKHHLDRFMPFDRCLFVDADMVWCRNPDPLWASLASYGFTATGLERADFWFGGPKGLGIIADWALDRRRRTMRRFDLTYLPRIQAGMIYAADRALTSRVARQAASFLARRPETHFRSRLDEGRSEESCEWSLAMAMSRLGLPVFPWFQGQNSPQLDFIPDLVTHDRDFTTVECRYYTHPAVYAHRGIPSERGRRFVIRWTARLPGRGDWIPVTPFTLHFSWLRHKKPFIDFADRCWDELFDRVEEETYDVASVG